MYRRNKFSRCKTEEDTAGEVMLAYTSTELKIWIEHGTQ